MFTTQDLITAPRCSPAISNCDGTYLMFVETRFDEDTQETTRLLKIAEPHNESGAQEIVLASGSFHDPVWIPKCAQELCYLRPEQSGTTACVVDIRTDETYIAANIPAEVENLKLCKLKNGRIGFVVSGLVGRDGKLYNEATSIKTTSARVFDTARIHSWDKMIKDQRYSLWYNQLAPANGKWELSGRLFNLLPDSTLEAPLGVYDLYDPLDNFDVCDTGVAFTATDSARSAFEPEQVSLAYFAPLASFESLPSGKVFEIRPPASVRAGASTNMRISPDGAQIAFIHNDYSDPCNNKIIVASLDGEQIAQSGQVLTDYGDLGMEDPPIAFEFYQKSNNFLLQRIQAGRIVLMVLEEGKKARDVLTCTHVSGLCPKDDDRNTWLITTSSFIERLRWTFFEISTGQEKIIRSTQDRDEVEFGLTPDMLSEFYCNNSEGAVRSWMIRPREFDEKKTYPWIMLPHGGPETAWMNAWTTRWNAALFAQQGYIVILPDLAGSLGYGIDFTRRVQGDWGGAPLRDIESVISHVGNLAFADNKKALLAGASFGGYLISWMMGEDLIKKFCGVVWHDGRFDMVASSPRCDIFLWDAAFGGSGFSWENEVNLEKFNPARTDRLLKWKNAPPTLVIHGEKDYRCPFGEGVAAFRTLQRHGIQSRFLVFPDEGHWVLKPANAIFWLDSILDWMDTCIHKKSSSVV